MPETIKAYLETVQEQIRWKRARPVLMQELERHLEDQRDDFIKEGKPEDEAERLAVQDMGDPVALGTELDAVHRPKPQWGLLGLTIGLALAGAVLRVVFRQPYRQPGLAAAKALASLGLGTAAMLGMYFLDVSRLARYARAVYIAALATGVLSLELFSSPSHLPYRAFYVVELYPVVYALWVYSFRNKGWRGLALTILGGVPLAAICCMIPSMTGLFLFLFSGLAVTLCAAWQNWFGIGRWNGTVVTSGAALSIPAVLLSQGYLNSFRERLQIAFHPELDRLGSGFTGWMLQTFWEDIPPLRSAGGEASIAVNAGMRVGWRTQPIHFSSDFLPAQMAFQWGWVPLLLLIAALTALLLWLLVKGLRQKHLLGRFVVLAAALTLSFQTLFSAALNLGFVLFSASLPLVVGNLMTVLDMALIGLVLSVFRGETIGREEPALPFRKLRLRIRIEME